MTWYPCASSRRVLLRLFRVLAAINFDDQPIPQAAEVHYVIVNWMLASKLGASQAPGAEVLPQEVLGRGLFAAEAADIVTQLIWCAHNDESYCKRFELMEDPKRSRAESGADDPLRSGTIGARSHGENRAGPSLPINGGEESRGRRKLLQARIEA